jgi:S-DNA-T family DNA segregation ATPase FtsK/SpoIIIE
MDSENLSEARLRHQLGVQAQQINRVLSHHRVPATVAGGEVRPRLISFDIQTQLAAGLERVRGLKDDLINALGVNDVAVVREEGQWRLRVGRPDDAPVPLLRLLASLPDLPPLTAAIGLADGGQPVLLRFGASRVKHVLIAGEPGAGKTTLLRTIAAGLALTNRQAALQLLLLDPRGLGDLPGGVPHPLRPLGYLPHGLTDPTDTPEDCAAVVHFLAEEMEYRRREQVQWPRVVALIDHVVTLIDEAGDGARHDLLRLLQYGAAAGIHLVMATDQPDAPFLMDRTLRVGVSARLVGRLTDVAAARKVAGMALENAPALNGGGDFLAVVGSEVTYFQAAYIGDYDLHLELSKLATEPRPRLLARPYSPRPRLARETPAAQKTFQWRDGTVDLSEAPADHLSLGDVSEDDEL